MRYLIGLCCLLVLGACAKPADPTKSNYPIYGSVSVVDGVEVACDNCAILEVNGRALRVTFTDNGLDECSGQGSLSYLASNNLDFPVNDGESISWTGVVVGDNSGKYPYCFPEQLDLVIDKLSTNLYQISYNGKMIKVQKLN